jgi:hypothetical protein
MDRQDREELFEDWAESDGDAVGDADADTVDEDG